MKRLLAFFLSVSLLFSVFAKLEKGNIKLISELDELYSRFDELSELSKLRIDSLRSSVDSVLGGEIGFSALERLGDEYVEQNLDSAMFYWHVAQRNAVMEEHEADDKRLKLKMLSYLPCQGLGLEALKNLDEFKVEELSDSLRLDYWVCASRIFTTLMDVHPPGILKEQYRQKAMVSLDSLSHYYPDGSPESSYIISVLHYTSGDEHLAVANLSQLLPYFQKTSQLYELALSKMVDYYKDKPQNRQEYIMRILMLTKSSMQRGVVIPSVMAEAGRILYDEGYKSLGRSLILKAMKSKLSGVSSYSKFDHTEYIDYLYGKALYVRIWIGVLFSLLVIAIVVITFIAVKAVSHAKARTIADERKINMLDSKNKELGKSLDSAISLSFFSNEQLREYNLYIQRKLKAGQVRDLYRDADSGEYMAEMHRAFFDTFDQLFMDNFPDFVDKLNELLLPDRKLSLLPGNHFSPELRIAAYMRFGMNDSAKLSKALGLSLNTIYTYRNRLKGRAIDKVNFEENVRNMVSE